jgi:CDP-glucose 4,6-dehydratase
VEGLELSMDWKERRVFVTGASGIVGSWLVKRLLADGAYVAVLVRDWDPQSELIRSGDVQRTAVVSGRLEDYDTLERGLCEHDIDTVFHLGAQTIVGTALRSPLVTFEANIRGTYNLLEACRRQSALVKRVVVASSDKAYGDVDTLPYTEDMPVNGRHPYDVSKSCTDLIAASYAHTYDLPVSTARCGNIYGGGDLNWSRLIPGTIRSVRNGERPILRSDGTFLRDYIYVQDVVDAYLTLARHTEEDGVRGQAFNFGPGRGMTVLDMTRRILKLMDRSDLDPVILDQAKAEIKHQYLDSSRANTRLGWRMAYEVDDALRETIAWYDDFLGHAPVSPAPRLQAVPAGGAQ